MNQIEFALTTAILSMAAVLLVLVYCSGIHFSVRVRRLSGRVARMRKAGRFIAWLLALLSLPALVAIQELVPETTYVEARRVGVALIIVIAVILITLSAFNQAKLEELKIKEEDSRKRDSRSASVLSHVGRLCDYKAERLRDTSYSLSVGEGEWPYFYNIHQYLRQVCDEMRSTVAEVMGAEVGKVDASLIYRYIGEDDWKWAAGKSGMSDVAELNEFVKDEETLYHYLISHEEESPVFCNDKTKASHYKPGNRDRLFGCRGSFFAMKLVYANNDERLVEAILLVSTYGANFVLPELGDDEVEKFHVALTYEVVPPFISILQVELGELYARHNWKRVKCLGTTGKFVKNPVVEMGKVR